MILKVCDWVITEAIHNNLESIHVSENINVPQEHLEKEIEAGKGGEQKA